MIIYYYDYFFNFPPVPPLLGVWACLPLPHGPRRPPQAGTRPGAAPEVGFSLLVKARTTSILMDSALISMVKRLLLAYMKSFSSFLTTKES